MHPPRRAFRAAWLLLALLGTTSGVPAAAAAVRTYHGASQATQLRMVEKLGREGFRPISLCIYGTPVAPLYTAVWVKRAGPPWTVASGLSAPAYQAFAGARGAQGFRPLIVSAAGPDAAQARFAGVWVKDGVRAAAKVNLSAQAFAGENDRAHDRSGYALPAWVAVYGTAAQPLYAGVWEANTTMTGWSCQTGPEPPRVSQVTNAFRLERVRPALVTPGPDGGYTGLWTDDTLGEQEAFHSLSRAAFQAKVSQLARRGLFPIRVQATGTEPAAVLAAVFARRDRPLPRRFTATGQTVPGLAPLDAYLRGLMEAQGVRAASIAIARRGKLAYARAYTWAEAGYPVTRPDSLFRIASCTKPLTSIAIHQLIEQGDLSLDDGMQEILQLRTPAGGPPVDPRFDQVLVWHLLSHFAGWNVDTLGFEPMFNDVPTVAAFGAQLPATKYQIADYMAGYALNTDPGTTYSYSNFGYSLLGQIIEKKRPGLTFTEAVKESIFRPLGVTRPRLDGTLLSERAPGEVFYDEMVPTDAASVMSPPQPRVTLAYGGMNLRNMDAHGGLRMAAGDFAKVLAAFDPGVANPLLQPATIATMWTAPKPVEHPGVLRGWDLFHLPDRDGVQQPVYTHAGWLFSSTALIFHRADGVDVVLFFNKGVDTVDRLTAQGEEINRLINQVDAWPDRDLFPSLGIPSFP